MSSREDRTPQHAHASSTKFSTMEAATDIRNLPDLSCSLLSHVWPGEGHATPCSLVHTYCHVVIVTRDGVWIGDWIYWTLNTRNYK
jgi:hypothetical protein